MIKVNLERTNLKIEKMQKKVVEINEMIDSKTGKGNDFLGWTDYAKRLPHDEIERINKAAKKILDNCEVLVVIGIGGSYLGSKASIDAINGIVNKGKVEIIFLGNTVSPTYTSQVIKHIRGKKIAINVISKSGTTTEPALAFNLALKEAKAVWNDKYNEYVFATTDAARGALKEISRVENYETFVIPDDVGGRYSVFTPVGLLPMAVARLDIEAFIKGTIAGIEEYKNPSLEENEAYKYAVSRYLLSKDKQVEFLITYEPHLCGLAEWWKQLYGESEGKDGKGLLPASLCFSTDLHSMGQFAQEGSNVFFETTILLDNYQDDIDIEVREDNLDNTSYLKGKKYSFVNNQVITSTLDAHFVDGKRNNIVIELDKMDEFNLGKLMYFFCKACAMSAYLLDVNPFNQPGVEIYKARMKALLKK